MKSGSNIRRHFFCHKDTKKSILFFDSLAVHRSFFVYCSAHSSCRNKNNRDSLQLPSFVKSLNLLKLAYSYTGFAKLNTQDNRPPPGIDLRADLLLRQSQSGRLTYGLSAFSIRSSLLALRSTNSYLCKITFSCANFFCAKTADR